MSRDSPRDLTDEEVKLLVQQLAHPTFKYLMRRMNKEILRNEQYSDLSMNAFLSIMCASLASIDANALRWMENFYQLQTGSKLDFDKLRTAHTRNLYSQLDIMLQ